MNYFIVTEENAHYFYIKGRGICRRSTIYKTEPQTVFEDGTDDFSLMYNGSVNIICTNAENEIYYIKDKHAPLKIMSGREGIKPYDFRLCNGFDLFYKTDYEGETLLFYCKLGVSDKPRLLDTLFPGSGYDCGAGKVFYTDTKKNLVCVCITTGEKNVVSENSFMPCFAEINSSEYLLYKKENEIILNSKSIVSDEAAVMPVIFRKGEYTYIQWKTGSFIRYTTISPDGEVSGIKRYIGPGTEPVIINVSDKSCAYKCYGYNGMPFMAGVSGVGVVKEKNMY